MDRLSIDYETYSDADLPKVGVSRYAKDPSTEVLMAAFSFNYGPVRQWIPAEGEPIPRDLAEALVDPEVQKWAWNAAFEINITREKVCPVDIRQWRCSMVIAKACSLPGSLDRVGKIIKIDEASQKLESGTRLMKKFSSPRKPTVRDPRTRVLWHEAFADWEDYLEYNRTDVIAEMAVLKRLKKYDLPEHEWDLWHIDQEINSRGLPVNMRMVRNANLVYEAALEKGTAEMAELTGLNNPNSPKQLLPWLQENGYPFHDLKKGHVKRAIQRAYEQIEASGNDAATIEEMKPYIRTLEMRKELSRTSITKFAALERATDTDGNLRYTLQFCAAGRTWRWGGRLFQPQNLPRPEKVFEKAPWVHAANVESLNLEQLEAIYGNVFDLLASTIRPAVQAPDGYLLVDADLSAIENIVLGYISGCQKILNVFKEDRDPYIDFATYLFGRPYAELWAEYKAGNGAKRTISKPGVLGCLKAETPVLTHRGWKALVEVRHDDWLHDGEKWVRHGGVVFRGHKPVLCRSGIHATSDHKFLAESGWVEWQQASGLPTFNSALVTASGVLSNTQARPDLQVRSSFAFANVVENESYLDQTSCEDYPEVAPAALRLTVAAASEKESARICSTYSQIVSTLRDRVVKTHRTLLTATTGAGEFLCSSVAPPNGSNMPSMFSVQTERLKSTGSTMTEITAREIFDLQPDPSKTQIADTWDILNTGDYARFAVLTDDGCLLAHNCGYMLGPGDEVVNHETGEVEGTGLLGYAWNMGVKHFTKQDSVLSVETFRREFSEVKDYWYGVEKAAIRCVTTGNRVDFGHVVFEMENAFLRVRLPSGRYLRYLRPKVEQIKAPWGDMKRTLTYEGENDRGAWARIQTHPGKITENIDQAIARDILATGIVRAYRRGLDVRLHVHDQIVSLSLEEKASRDLEILNECMATPPSWAPDIPLRTAGFTSKVFMKD